MWARLRSLFLAAIFLVLAVVYIIKNASSPFLKLYVRQGMGDCRTNPILCAVPQVGQIAHQPDKAYLEELKLFRFDKLQILLPKDFKVVLEQSEKFYYKKRPWRARGGTVFLLLEPAGYFISMLPELKKKGITNDYEFIERLLSANLEGIATLGDVFFVVLKGLFTPNLGPGKEIKIVRFSTADKKGFISYNLGPSANYFDCNVFDSDGNYFAVYIQDALGKLKLENVLTIISTVKRS